MLAGAHGFEDAREVECIETRAAIMLQACPEVALEDLDPVEAFSDGLEVFLPQIEGQGVQGIIAGEEVVHEGVATGVHPGEEEIEPLPE